MNTTIQIKGMLSIMGVMIASMMTLSAQTRLVSSVIGAGGGIASGSGVIVDGTIGQPVIGPVTGTGGKVFQGFWYMPQTSTPSGVASEEVVGRGMIAEAFPNPCSADAVLRLVIDSRSPVRASIFDQLGNEVATLYDGSSEAGEIRIGFDATSLPAGRYTIRVIAGKGSRALPLVVVR
jgi:hypothetical protein